MNCFDKRLMMVGGMVGVILLAFGAEMISTDPSSDPTVGEGALSRDAAYTGSLTLAGLAIFGSALTSRIGSSTKADSPNRSTQPADGTGQPAAKPDTGVDSLDRHTGIMLATFAPLTLAGMHLLFAAHLCCNEPGPLVGRLAIFSTFLLAMSVAGYVMLLTGPRRSNKN